MTRANSHIAKMAAYTVADLEISNAKHLISLSQNESFRQPSPAAMESASNSLKRSMLYPDPEWTELRLALSDHHRISAKDIVCGNGSLDLIGALARVFSSPQRAVLAPAHAYPYFRTAAQMAGARFDTAGEVGLTADVDYLLESVQPDTGLLFLANPGNPTGTRICKDELVRLREGLRQDILLVIDEAYGEFADHIGERSFDMVDIGNTVVLRTFSKAYSMAGFRVGWGLFPEAIGSQIRKVLNPNNVSLPSQASAIKALEDHEYMLETVAIVGDLRSRVVEQLRAGGFNVLDSYTNFVLVDCETGECAVNADGFLRRKNVVVRRQGGVGLPHMLRVTIGPAKDLEFVVGRLLNWKNHG